MLIVDAAAFHDRGGDLAARAKSVKTVFTLGPAGYGADLAGRGGGGQRRANLAGPTIRP